MGGVNNGFGSRAGRAILSATPGGAVFRSCLFRLLAIPLSVVLLLALYETVQVMRAKARTPAALARVAARPLRLADLPEARRDMLVRIDDPGFYAHHGIDMATPGAGWTTITQALVKQLYFEHFRPGFAKIEQSLIARFVLDPAVSKDEQLEIFVNYAYFGSKDGREITGFADAARSYYGRELAELGDREYLSLVAMLIGPNEYDPVNHPQANARRTERIEALLAGRCKPSSWRDVTYPSCDLPLAPSEPPGNTVSS